MSLLQFSEPKGTTVTMNTTHGSISLMFFPDEAPKCTENFITHAKNGYYNGVTFHRVIKGFMIQGGDPEGTGMGGESIWGEGIADEYSDKLFHFKGALCMAKSSLPCSIGSQFYIVEGTEISAMSLKRISDSFGAEVAEKYAEVGGYPPLDQNYTVFGQVYAGLDVIGKISSVETDDNDMPLEPVVILSMEVND